MIKKYAPLAFVVIVALGLMYSAFVIKPPGSLTDMAGVKVGGDYALVDHNGKKVTPATYAGKYKLIYFGFATCPDICPTELTKVADAMDRAGDTVRAKITPLFITVDPARDTPAKLKEYLAMFDAGFIGLTGTEAQVDVAMKAYRIYAQKLDPVGNADYMINHSSFIYLMDPADKPLAIYRKEDKAAKIADDLKKRVK